MVIVPAGDDAENEVHHLQQVGRRQEPDEGDELHGHRPAFDGVLQSLQEPARRLLEQQRQLGNRFAGLDVVVVVAILGAAAVPDTAASAALA